MEIRFRRIEYLSCKIDTNLRVGNKMEERKKKKKKNVHARILDGRPRPSRVTVKEKFLIAIEYPSRCKNRNMDLMDFAGVIYLHGIRN